MLNFFKKKKKVTIIATEDISKGDMVEIKEIGGKRFASVISRASGVIHKEVPAEGILDHSAQKIMEMALNNGCRFVRHQPDQRKFRFAKGKDTLIDVWYSKMTVATILTHPKKGRKSLFRRNVSMQLLQEIFQNPRVHTGAGYY